MRIARRVRRAARGNGPGAIRAPRPGPTQLAQGANLGHARDARCALAREAVHGGQSNPEANMDIRYTAHGLFWMTEDDRPAAERPVSGGKTSWVVRDICVLPSHEDMLVAAPDTSDFSRWMINGRVVSTP